MRYYGNVHWDFWFVQIFRRTIIRSFYYGRGIDRLGGTWHEIDFADAAGNRISDGVNQFFSVYRDGREGYFSFFDPAIVFFSTLPVYPATLLGTRRSVGKFSGGWCFIYYHYRSDVRLANEEVQEGSNRGRVVMKEENMVMWFIYSSISILWEKVLL